MSSEVNGRNRRQGSNHRGEPAALPVTLPTLSRRNFCACAGRAGALVAFGGLAACASPTEPAISSGLVPTVSGRTVSVTVTAESSVANVGGVGFLGTSLGDFLLVRTTADAFTVLSAICTHQQCTITGFNGEEFLCPCHGSRFTTSGEVAQGPASRPLPSFANTFDGTDLTFTV